MLLSSSMTPLYHCTFLSSIFGYSLQLCTLQLLTHLMKHLFCIHSLFSIFRFSTSEVDSLGLEFQIILLWAHNSYLRFHIFIDRQSFLPPSSHLSSVTWLISYFSRTAPCFIQVVFPLADSYCHDANTAWWSNLMISAWFLLGIIFLKFHCYASLTLSLSILWFFIPTLPLSGFVLIQYLNYNIFYYLLSYYDLQSIGFFILHDFLMPFQFSSSIALFYSGFILTFDSFSEQLSYPQLYFYLWCCWAHEFI